jgi:Transposase domain (DUF772)
LPFDWKISQATARAKQPAKNGTDCVGVSAATNGGGQGGAAIIGMERFYGHNGHEGTDPVILVKMLLLLFLDNVPSQQELMGVIHERLDYLWFLGYGLDDEIPNHGVLSKARARWGREGFVICLCGQRSRAWQPGWWTDGRCSSLVRANTARESVREGLRRVPSPGGNRLTAAG